MTNLKFLLPLALTITTALAQPVIEVSSHVVTAGDLAQSAPPFASVDPTAVVAKAPAPGAVRRVNQLQLQRWATSLGASGDIPGMPNAIALRRATRILTPPEIELAVSGALVNAHGLQPEHISVAILTAASVSVPAGQVTVECLCARLLLNESTPLRLRWKEPGGRSGIELLQGLVTVQGVWLEASHDLRSNAALRASDIVERSGTLPRLGNYPSHLELDGSETLIRPMKAGAPVLATFIRSAPLVSRGDLLELRFHSGRVQLRTAGRAEESGSVGDFLSFRNIATGQRIVARVTDAQTAHVEAFHATR